MSGVETGKKMLFIGENGAGKTALMEALSGKRSATRRPMAVEYCGRFVNTPGEFLENRRFYPAIITTSADCDVVVMVQDATRINSLFPPQFASLFTRRVVGVVSKVQMAGANADRAIRFLKSAGAREIVLWNSDTGEGLERLQAMLQ
ncbi:EutP/PduV family microcompartment system protein [Desulfobotulus sp. H1]|uniref:EutP/PduV family microcompartment system protein n=1 Tax=Desulfobotulus pelophilus TaxID=2823377 RepID=A0ABT3N7D1_9BACT|nr:EutP/PduV family microcompartment system protein [Desulfobotulus pelophilus]MCW7753363.1 EutP/PduV family microcompartment system protein [Desulfobotulus pelophilus]